MVSHIHQNLNANENFVISFTSKFITCFIDIHLHAFGFHFEDEILINYLFNEGK